MAVESEEGAKMPKTTRLRTYTVREGMMDEWVERWRSQTVPLHLELGFEIGGAWVDRERNRFIWLLSYDGPEDAHGAGSNRATGHTDAVRDRRRAG